MTMAKILKGGMITRILKYGIMTKSGGRTTFLMKYCYEPKDSFLGKSRSICLQLARLQKCSICLQLASLQKCSGSNMGLTCGCHVLAALEPLDLKSTFIMVKRKVVCESPNNFIKV